LIPSTVGGSGKHQLLSSFLIDEKICVDAGSIGFHLDLNLQLSVKHIFLTHGHSDHLASLPIFLDAHFGEGSEDPIPVVIHADEATSKTIMEDVLNDRHWPDFFRISEENNLGMIELRRVIPGEVLEIEGYKITPVRVDHVVDTLAYVVEKDGSALAVVTDTGPTDEIWEVCSKIKGLNTVILELSFPDSLQWLAEVSKHLTTSDFVKERAKLPGADGLRFLAVHLKVNQYDNIVRELNALELPGVEVMQPGVDYSF